MIPRDLERYLEVYAPRIRFFMLGYFTSVNVAVSAETLHALHLATRSVPGALASKIVTLHWPLTAFTHLGITAIESAASHISLFVGSNLSSLVLSGSPRDRAGVNQPLPPLYRTALFLAAERLRGLKKLRLDFMTAPTSIFVESFITGYPWSNLQALSAKTISQKALSKIALLPQLAALELQAQESLPLRYNPANPPTYPPPDHFQSLRKLVLYNTKEISSVISILQHIPTGNQLQILTVDVQGPNAASLEEAEGFFSTVVKHCNPSKLRSFSLLINHNEDYEEGLEVDLNHAIDISPLFSFSLLNHLCVETLHRLRFAPPQIAEMVKCLPGLQTLRLSGGGSSGFTTVPPSLGFEDIMRLARGIPNLRYLKLRFDATQINGDELAPDVPAHCLDILDVNTSPILSPSRVLRCLQANFPKLRSVGRGHHSDDIFLERWNVVQQGLRAM